MRTDIEFTCSFSSDGDAKGYQIYGWHGAEPGHTWMDAAESALIFPSLHAPQGFFLEADLVSHRPAGTSAQMLTIDVNGVRCGREIPVVRGVYAWYVPPLRRHDQKILVVLRHPGACAPGAHDDRLLSVGVISMRIRVSRESFQTAGKRLVTSTMTLQSFDYDAVCKLTGLSIQEFVMEFESIGDDCELGVLQRLCEAEPLGLFRFSSLHLPYALRAVESDFANMGDELDVSIEGLDREWMVRERRYLMRWHTFIRDDNASRDEILAREKKKLAFLIRKIRRDIRESGKVFVVKSRESEAEEEEIIPLHLALNLHAPNWLLWIVPADGKHLPGSVEELQPRLLKGYVDRFSIPGIEGSQNSVGWLTTLANAWSLKNHIEKPTPALPMPELDCT